MKTRAGDGKAGKRSQCHRPCLSTSTCASWQAGHAGCSMLVIATDHQSMTCRRLPANQEQAWMSKLHTACLCQHACVKSWEVLAAAGTGAGAAEPAACPGATLQKSQLCLPSIHVHPACDHGSQGWNDTVMTKLHAAIAACP